VKKTTHYRHTKIIFTIGPATIEEEVLEALIHRGVDVCRFNMAHATHEWVESAIETIRRVCEKTERQVALLMDVKGPEIRTGFLEKAIDLKKDDKLELWMKTSFERREGVHQIDVNYRSLAGDVKVGDVILVDSGLLRLEILETNEDHVVTKVLTPGSLGARRHINLPGVNVKLPSLTEKDLNDVRFGVKMGIDIFALSFARTADAVSELKKELQNLESAAQVMAKLEDQTALRNLKEIVEEADSIMIARGDLGIEIPFEELPLVQNQVMEECLTQGTPFVVATHLLESMISAPMPTRAEVSDVANAVREQADCIMLSGETTTGAYPVEAVDVMNRVIDATEVLAPEGFNDRITLRLPKSKLIRSAAVLAGEFEDAAILLFTRSSYTAQITAALRPVGVPIYAFV